VAPDSCEREKKKNKRTEKQETSSKGRDKEQNSGERRRNEASKGRRETLSLMPAAISKRRAFSFSKSTEQRFVQIFESQRNFISKRNGNKKCDKQLFLNSSCSMFVITYLHVFGTESLFFSFFLEERDEVTRNEKETRSRGMRKRRGHEQQRE